MRDPRARRVSLPLAIPRSLPSPSLSLSFFYACAGHAQEEQEAPNPCTRAFAYEPGIKLQFRSAEGRERKKKYAIPLE